MIQNDVLSTAAKEGRQERREEGKREKNIEDARTMKALKISSEVIHQMTGLPIKDIELYE